MARNYVYEELNRFIQLDAEDAKRAKEIAPIVLGNFDAIADAVYADMQTDPRAVSAFKSQERMNSHRRPLLVWMEEAFSGVYDENYYETRLMNGRRHAEVALFPHFIFGKMTLIRQQIVDTIARADLSIEQIAAYIDTTNRIIDLDLAITIQSYWDTLVASKLKVPLALSSGLAHEIRNPLNGIALNISLLERKLARKEALSPDTTAVLDAIKGELQRINGLTTEIMNFAKPITIERDFIRASELIDKVNALQEAALISRGIEYTAELIGPDTIYADYDRLFQVLLNLIANAADALDHREDQKQIAFSIDNSKSATTTIKVSDNGCGMSPEVTDRIFDLYYTTKASGTGLGMAIVQKIIEAHHGMIRVSSELGRGTTVMIFLPRPMHEELAATS